MSEQIEVGLIAETENFAVFRNQDDEDTYFHVELNSATLHFTAEEWEEFVVLIKDAARQ